MTVRRPLTREAITMPHRPRLGVQSGYARRGFVVMSECQTLGTAPLLAGSWPFLTDKPCWQ